MHQQAQTMVGVRIPINLKKRLSAYCLNHGIKLNFFITEAIDGHLNEATENYNDMIEAKKRLENPQYLPETEISDYLKKRGIKK